MVERKLFSSGTQWEDIVGYSRAVKVGNVIEVSGTTAVDGNRIVGKDDVFEQALFIFKKIEQTLQEAGSCLEDVVRTRMFVIDISKWKEIGKAHAIFFKNIKPVTSMIEVSSLVDKGLLIEVEVTAVIAKT